MRSGAIIRTNVIKSTEEALITFSNKRSLSASSFALAVRDIPYPIDKETRKINPAIIDIPMMS
tara:strand:- start:634 stop:822 length:189 start_codon:yes stop_codon:yes gene_type:complete